MKHPAIKAMNREREFMVNTCPASRHTAMIAEALCNGKPYAMLTEESERCGESLAATVTALWEARTLLHKLGWDQVVYTASDGRLATKWQA